ncbi:hypothetical protein LCGC14_0359350 [marine sediment metagenome]|uniref:PD-(D/E)XK endonuclease-like domain-containing protein n=1 Tax=marine sediment metagenome TaxID=412755 RepID=A0A0F9T8G6_9ZZZZ
MAHIPICLDHDDTRKPCLYYIRDHKPGFCRHKEHYRCIEYIRMKQPILSYSYLNTYKACLREFLFAWLMGYRLLEPSFNAETSSIFHGYMAGFYSGLNTHIIDAEKKLAKLRSRFPEGKVPNEVKCVTGVANAYYELKKKGIAKIIGKCKVEQTALEYREGYAIKNIIDMILNNGETGYEWKYAKTPDIYGAWTMRLQLMIYFISRPKLKEVVVRAIKKPQLKQGKNEDENEFVDRVTKTFKAQRKANIISNKYYRSEFDLIRGEREIVLISEQLKQLIEQKDIAAFWQNQNCCYFNGYRDWTCDFLKCCEADLLPKQLPELYGKIDIEHKMDTGEEIIR